MAAVTFTNVSNANGSVTEDQLFGFKARLIDVTLATSYSTGGDTLTATALGVNNIVGWIPCSTMAAPTGGATGKAYSTVVNASGSTLSFQGYNENDAAAYAQRPNQAELQAASNNGTFKVRGIVLFT
jgi:hypothetical protein